MGRYSPFLRISFTHFFTALHFSHFAPELPVITKGDIKVFGVTRHIYKGTKCRNPDGTVNYVRLDVM